MSQVLAGYRRICEGIRWRTGFSRGKPLPKTAVATCYFFRLIKHVWWLKIWMTLLLQHAYEPVAKWDDYPSRETTIQDVIPRLALNHTQGFQEAHCSTLHPRLCWLAILTKKKLIPVSLVNRWWSVYIYTFIFIIYYIALDCPAGIPLKKTLQNPRDLWWQSPVETLSNLEMGGMASRLMKWWCSDYNVCKLAVPLPVNPTRHAVFQVPVRNSTPFSCWMGNVEFVDRLKEGPMEFGLL